MDDLDKGGIKHILAWSNGQPQPPLVLNLRLTERCNLKCLSCERHTTSPSEELSSEILLDILEQANELGIKHLNIDGSGELFLRKKTALMIMQKAKEFGMTGTIVTNATLLEKKDIEIIEKMDWDEVLVSLDGPDVEIHDGLRGVKGSFEKTIQTLKWFKGKTRFEIATLLTNQNFNKIKQIFHLINGLGLDCFRLQVLQERTPKVKSLLLNKKQEQQFQRSIPKLIRLAEELGIDENLEFFRDQEMVSKSCELGTVIQKETNHQDAGIIGYHCHLPWLYIGVRENGFVEPCYGSSFNKINITENKLEDIWKGEFFSSVRESIADNRMYPCCRTCCGSQVVSSKELREKAKNQK